MSGMSETVSYDDIQLYAMNRQFRVDYLYQRFGTVTTPKKLDFGIDVNDGWMEDDEDEDFAIAEGALGF